MPIPPLEPLDEYFPYLCRMVAKTSWLPHPDTVRALGRAAFPTSRARKHHPLFSISDNEKPVRMYDDNITPTWAVLWAHGIVDADSSQKRSGWTFAHTWPSPASDDVNSYTHLANLVMIPECFASLTDKKGPLTGYLRWHAWTVYGWKPDPVKPPEMPVDYNKIQWRYFLKCDAPRTVIATRLAKLDNKRVRILKKLAQRNSACSST